MTTLPGKPRSYAEVAAELHRIADVLADLPGCPSYVSLGIQPGPRNGDNDSVSASVDAVARAVLGKPGKTEQMSGGTWQRAADSWLGVMAVRIYDKVSGPPDERDAEIERLRSELAEARVRAMPVPNVDQTPTRHMRAGFGYSREADDPVPGAVPGGVDGHSEFSGRASVPDMVTRYFKFGHGQTDPDTGERLIDKYVTVIAPTVEACRAAMFASRYGNRWSFDYAPEDPKWSEWGPRWTEHDRIVVGPAPDPYCGGE